MGFSPTPVLTPEQALYQQEQAASLEGGARGRFLLLTLARSRTALVSTGYPEGWRARRGRRGWHEAPGEDG